MKTYHIQPSEHACSFKHKLRSFLSFECYINFLIPSKSSTAIDFADISQYDPR